MAEEEQKVVDAATSTEGTVKRRKWFPLESNPDVCNKYIKNLGWPTEMYEFYELMSTEDWAIGMVPGPIMAILLLFPISERSEAAKQAQEEEIKANGQQVPEDTFFLKQTIGNACGTIGLIHALTNAAKSHQVPIEQDKFLHRFATLTATMTPQERGHELEYGTELAHLIEVTHHSAAQEGQSSIDMNTNAHFLAIVPKDGRIIELDGRKAFAIDHGPYESLETFALEASEKVVRREFMDKDPDEIRFSMMALGAAGGD